MTVDVVEAMGFEAYAHGTVGTAPFIARLDGDALPAPGERIGLEVSGDAVHLFDRESGRALS
jgi:hypothetical protein